MALTYLIIAYLLRDGMNIGPSKFRIDIHPYLFRRHINEDSSQIRRHLPPQTAPPQPRRHSSPNIQDHHRRIYMIKFLSVTRSVC